MACTNFSAPDAALTASLWSQAVAEEMSYSYLQTTINDALNSLLEEFSGRYFVLPLPKRIRIYSHVMERTGDIHLEFNRPERDWAVPVDGGLWISFRHPQEMDGVVASIIQQAYSDYSRNEDLRRIALIMWQVTETLRGPRPDLGRIHSDLLEKVQRYYRENIQIEPYFSLRDYEVEEDFYFERRRRNRERPPRDTSTVESLDEIYLDFISLCPRPPVSQQQIMVRKEEVEATIARILMGNEDPDFFDQQHHRYRSIKEEEDYRRQNRRSRREPGELTFPVRPRRESPQFTPRPFRSELRWTMNPVRERGGVFWDDEVWGTTPGNKEAEARGEKLLLENLTPAQTESYTKSKFFYVTGGKTGKLYKIVHGRQQNVFEVDKKTYRQLKGLCFLPAGNLCVGDTLLTQKISLELHEEEVLKIAIPF